MTGREFPDTAAVILAAGFSSRMGRFKPLLPLGGGSVFAHITAVYRSAGISRLLAVSGHAAEDLHAEAAALGVPVVHNPRYAEDMFTSVRTGLAGIHDATNIFIQPVDIPLVRADTIAHLALCSQEHDCAVALPEFLGETGHPPLLKAELVPSILDWNGDNGLQGALEQYAPCRLAVADRNILFDMDTPEAYAEALSRQVRAHIPTPGEAMELLRLYAQTPERGLAHARGVADVALALRDALSARGIALNRELIEAAALLHDIAKDQQDHEAAGGALLADLGFARIAEIVAGHRDSRLSANASFTEKEIVYLADKLVRGPFRIDLADRFAEKIAHWKNDAAASAAIQDRLCNALTMRARLEAELGLPLEDLLQYLNLPWDRRRA